MRQLTTGLPPQPAFSVAQIDLRRISGAICANSEPVVPTGYTVAAPLFLSLILAGTATAQQEVLSHRPSGRFGSTAAAVATGLPARGVR